MEHGGVHHGAVHRTAMSHCMASCRGAGAEQLRVCRAHQEQPPGPAGGWSLWAEIVRVLCSGCYFSWWEHG